MGPFDRQASQPRQVPGIAGSVGATRLQGRWGSQDGGLTSFVARLSPDGSTLTYSTYFTGAQALDVDAEGNAWVVAQAGPGFPVTAGALQRCLAGGGTDAVVAQLNSQGALAAGTYLGGIGVDLPTAVMAVPGNLAVVAGTTSSPGFDAAEAVPGFPIPSAAFAVELQIADPNRKDTPCMERALQNASSYAEGAIAPGELVTLRGLGFGPETGVIADMRIESPFFEFGQHPFGIVFVVR